MVQMLVLKMVNSPKGGNTKLRILRRIAELPRLKMNSVSDLGVCGYCVFVVRLPGGWGAFILEERREGVKGEGTVK